jgi:hypothetical protein
MRISISGEVDSIKNKSVGEDYHLVASPIKRTIQALLDKNDYGSSVSLLFLCPTIYSDEMLAASKYRERARWSPKTGETDLRLRIDYAAYAKADGEGRKRLLLENVVRSIRILDAKVRKAKGSFDGARLERDVSSAFGVRFGELDLALKK